MQKPVEQKPKTVVKEEVKKPEPAPKPKREKSRLRNDQKKLKSL